MADKQGQNKPTKLSNVGTTRKKEILVSKDRAGNFSGSKIANGNNIEQTAGARSRPDCETKPN